MKTQEIIKSAAVKATVSDLYSDSLESDISLRILRLLGEVLDSWSTKPDITFNYVSETVTAIGGIITVDPSASGSNNIVAEIPKQPPEVFVDNCELDRVLYPVIKRLQMTGGCGNSKYAIRREYNKLVIELDTIASTTATVCFPAAIKVPQLTSDELELPDNYRNAIIARLAHSVAVAFGVGLETVNSLAIIADREEADLKVAVTADKQFYEIDDTYLYRFARRGW